MLLMVIAILAGSCAKEVLHVEPSTKDQNRSQFKNFKRHVYKPTIFNLTDFSKDSLQDFLNNRKLNTVTFLRDSVWSNGLGKTTFYESTEIPAILQSTRDKIFLGAIIQGDKALDVENFVPVWGLDDVRNPITIYANFPTDSIYRTIMPSPKEDLSYIHDALKAGSGQQIQSFTYEQNLFRRSEELKKSFGANFNIGKILDVQYLDTTSSGNIKTRIRAEFTQENFTVSIEPPIYKPYLKESADMTIFNGIDPFIVSSVTYGRKGIFILESDSTYDMVRKTLQATLTLSASMVGASGGSELGSNFSVALGAHLTHEQKQVIENAYMKVYVIGVDGTSTVKAVVGGLAGFAEIIAKSGGFSSELRGAPIYYTLNYLSDFATFRNPFQIHVAYE